MRTNTQYVRGKNSIVHIITKEQPVRLDVPGGHHYWDKRTKLVVSKRYRVKSK